MSMSTCGGCKKIFSSMSLFDAHHAGSFSEPIYDDPSQRRPSRYKAASRRCMTTEEMLAAGYQCERKEVTVMIEGQGHREERDIWYDPIAREAARAAFRKDETEEESEE